MPQSRLRLDMTKAEVSEKRQSIVTSMYAYCPIYGSPKVPLSVAPAEWFWHIRPRR